MTYLSVCSGIEAATVAWHPLGWEPTAFSEIDPFPSAVLAYHYPTVPNLGDMTKYKEWQIERPNVLVGGTPCQSFSVAGLRRGLEDPRGNLMLVFLGLADHFKPTWIVWENVPGVLSSAGGRDFGSFLGGLAELGYGWAYRVLDAQYFGVAQRRRRVFVVGHLGDWRRAAQVLFESESLSGHPAPSREARKVAPTLSSSGAGVERTGNERTEADFLVECMTARFGHNAMGGPEDQHALHGAGLFVPSVINARQAIAFGENVRGELREMDVAPALASGGGKPGQGYSAIRESMAVRRLLPTECEALQGFSRNYTRIPWRGKAAEDCPDGPRYKALGNSMAVPCMAWIGQRIQMVEDSRA